MLVKVVPLRNYPGMASRSAPDEAAFDHADGDSSEEAEQSSPTDFGEGPAHAPKQKQRHHLKRPSPAAVIARAMNGSPPAGAVAIIAQALDRAPSGGVATGEAAFWDIWLTHRDYLRAHALRFSGGNLTDAEDALSDAMLKGANAFAKTAIRNQRGWLLRLVHNACMDYHRNNRRQNRLAKDIGDSEAQSAPAIAIQPERSPEELLAAMQEIGDLEQALCALPKFLAEPLMLHLDDLSDAEIACSLNVTKEVVRKRRQMARALLRRSTNY
jgi:RNA polymerase sigma factor (sigma-70 family)